MTYEGLTESLKLMEEADVVAPARAVFADFYRQLASGETGLIAEAEIEPLEAPPNVSGIDVSDQDKRDALAKTVIIKLNGGLGTSMGLDQAKSLLEVRDGLSFLDIIAQQVQAARATHDVNLPLLVMNSFRTRDDTLAVFDAYPDLTVEGLPLDFLQNREPKLTVDGLRPVSWPNDPELEWCPPGHGDIYPALEGSGVLKTLIDAGYRYASVSNSDNLGATPSPEIAAWFAQTGSAFAMEVCLRTENDRKGGHLARRKDDGQLILRESAQTAPEDMVYFTDETRHKYFNTNNLWLDLVAVYETLEEKNSVLGLPVIRNEKTVDPADSSSPKVIQIESAMGAGVQVFADSVAIEVGRDRFLPVKTTNELMLLRSDCYSLTEDFHLQAQVDQVPTVELDSQHYRTISDFEQRVPAPLSLRQATSFSVVGDVTFGADVTVVGEVALEAATPEQISDGAVLDGSS